VKGRRRSATACWRRPAACPTTASVLPKCALGPAGSGTAGLGRDDGGPGLSAGSLREPPRRISCAGAEERESEGAETVGEALSEGAAAEMRHGAGAQRPRAQPLSAASLMVPLVPVRRTNLHPDKPCAARSSGGRYGRGGTCMRRHTILLLSRTGGIRWPTTPRPLNPRLSLWFRFGTLVSEGPKGYHGPRRRAMKMPGVGYLRMEDDHEQYRLR
jgi:hypothetical protein